MNDLPLIFVLALCGPRIC